MNPSQVSKRPRLHRYTEEDMVAALATYKANGRKLRDAARQHGVPWSTLRDRINGKKSHREVSRTVLSEREEESLSVWIIECARRGFGRSKDDVFSEVQKVLNARGAKTVFTDNRPGECWLKGFLRRHPEISKRTPQALGSQRASVSINKIKGWFEAAEAEIREVGGDVLDHPSRIFNCDETGFQLGGGTGNAKVLAAKADKQTYRVTSDTHGQITVLATASACGKAMMPMLIFPGSRFNYDPMAGFEEAHFGRSDNGWIDSEVFTKWLEVCFVPGTEHLPKPVVLFADGHTTHANMKISDICREHNIILYQLPSHSSHILQPLDLTTFKSLKQAWHGVVREHMNETFSVVTKKDFAKLFRKAWDRGIKNDVVASGFRAAGIFPWDPNHFDTTKTAPSRALQTTTDDKAATDDMAVTDVTDTTSLTPPTPPCLEGTMTVTEVTDNKTSSLTPPPPPCPSLSISVPAMNWDTDLCLGSDDPPSPTYPSALPPLPSFSPLPSPSPTPAVPSTFTSSSDSSLPLVHFASPLPPVTITSSSISIPSAPSSSSIQSAPSSSSAPSAPSSTSAPSAPSSSSVTSAAISIDTPRLSLVEAFDRMLEVSAAIGNDGLLKYRANYAMGIEPSDSVEQMYRELYCRLRNVLTTDPTSTTTTTTTATRQDPNPTFDNLPLPSKKTPQKRRYCLQPPKMVNSDQYRQYCQNKAEEKKKEEEEKERKKKEKVEKKRKVEEEKKRKVEETKRRREEKEKLRMEKSQKTLSLTRTRRVGRRKKTATVVLDDTDNDSLTSSKCVDSDHDDIDNDNVCSICVGEKDDKLTDWIGCDCGKWFHVGCLSVTDDSLRDKTMTEIKDMTYICKFCK